MSMPSSLSNRSLFTHSPLSSSHMELQASDKVISEKQGIVAVLGPSDCERSKAASLRRTLSADMSSKKWLAHHGFSPMKKIASSQQLSFWGEKQQQQLDIWTSIVCHKANEEAQKSGPYVHPLVKKQSSSLNEKSLQVCTESLGSETGSEGFSSYPSSETGDVEAPEKDHHQGQEAEIQQKQQDGEEKVVEDVAHPFDGEEFQVVKYNSAAASKKLPPPSRSFPPPLPSLSGSDGASVRLRTQRDNGRLVLKAVSVPCPNNFRAQRRDGRLVLTFVAPSQTEAIIDEEETIREEEFEESFVEFGENEIERSDDDEEESDEVEKENNRIKGIEILREEEAPKGVTSRVTNVHRLALMMNNRPVGFANRNPGWANKFNEVVKYVGEEVDVVAEATTLAKSLPPRPGCVARQIPKPSATASTTTTAAAAATFNNAYEYYWRPKTSITTTSSQSLKNTGFMNQVANYEQQQLLLLRGRGNTGGGDHLAPYSKGCKEPRRSLLFWEPYCIATS